MNCTSVYAMTIMLAVILLSFSTAQCAEQAASAGQETGAAGSATASIESSPANSVLEKFRSYSGPRNPETLSALFTSAATGIVRQQPSVALSDGNSAVLVAIRVAATDNSAPGFAINGARQISLQRKQNDEWLLKAVPDKGVLSPSLTVRSSAATFEYSLAIAPPLPAGTDLSEQGFITFLAAAAADLNHDGMVDYIDDYIFTANYLSKHLASGTDREARRQRALRRTLSAPNSIPPPAAPAKDYDGVIYGDM